VNIANAYLVNTLGQIAYGDFSLSISLVFSLTPLFVVGITVLMTKYLPIYLADKATSKANVFLK